MAGTGRGKLRERVGHSGTQGMRRRAHDGRRAQGMGMGRVVTAGAGGKPPCKCSATAVSALRFGCAYATLRHGLRCAVAGWHAAFVAPAFWSPPSLSPCPFLRPDLPSCALICAAYPAIRFFVPDPFTPLPSSCLILPCRLPRRWRAAAAVSAHLLRVADVRVVRVSQTDHS